MAFRVMSWPPDLLLLEQIALLATIHIIARILNALVFRGVLVTRHVHLLDLLRGYEGHVHGRAYINRRASTSVQLGRLPYDVRTISSH